MEAEGPWIEPGGRTQSKDTLLAKWLAPPGDTCTQQVRSRGKGKPGKKLGKSVEGSGEGSVRAWLHPDQRALQGTREASNQRLPPEQIQGTGTSQLIMGRTSQLGGSTDSTLAQFKEEG